MNVIALIAELRQVLERIAASSERTAAAMERIEQILLERLPPPPRRPAVRLRCIGE